MPVLIGLEKKKTEARMRAAPTVNCPLNGVPNKIVETAVAKQTETPVASPLTIICTNKQVQVDREIHMKRDTQLAFQDGDEAQQDFQLTDIVRPFYHCSNEQTSAGL